ncbi:Aryl-alcohol dehydrogenase [Neofusicoccum parvum]|nr:Aryl-alcohol dehydrogenase [Neofusicoccum parvum]
MLSLYEDPSYDWSFLTEPQAALNGRQIACPRGRVLGGSSALNFSAILYPSKADFNDWAELNDDQSWSAEAMAPYLRKFHTFRPASQATKQQMVLDYIDEASHGTKGPLQVTIPDGYSPFHEAWVKGFKELGFHAVDDPIHGRTIGCFTNPVSIHPDTRTREYSAASYYTQDVANRPNLHVLTESVAETIIWADEAPLRATGVQVLRNGTERELIRVQEGGEVILAAGAIKSPQILELSGIGNERLLSQHGITTRFNNPGVGENFQDHVVSSISYEIADGQMSGDNLQHDPKLLQAVLNMYQESRSGPMAGTPLGTAYLPPVDKNGVIDKAEFRKLVDEHINLYPDFPAKAKQYELLRKRLTESGEPSAEFLFIPMQLNKDTKQNTMAYLFGGRTPGSYTRKQTQQSTHDTFHIRSIWSFKPVIRSTWNNWSIRLRCGVS